MARIEFDRIRKAWGDVVAVDALTLTIDDGEFVSLLGPSGCGKSTTLLMLAGIYAPTEGNLRFDGQVVNDVEARDRNVGIVFQSYALYPHMSVRENILFPLRFKKVSESEARRRVEEAAKLVHIGELMERRPSELSGGQQQRVALARALAPQPALLLLDEPFSSLDLDLRRALAQELGDILRQEKVTTLLVTHDQEEAFALADRVGVMQQGHLEQWDTPYNIYHAPTNRFVAEFAGYGTFLRGTVRDGNTVHTSLGDVSGRSHAPLKPGTEVEVLLRPEDVIADESAPLALPVTRRQFTGANILYHLRVDASETLLCQTDSHTNVVEGDNLHVRLGTKHLVTFEVS